MLLKNKAVKAIAGAVVLSCIMGGNVYAASSPTSVVIYSNDRSATSTSINCTGYIDGYGVNDASSTRSLYYTLRKKKQLEVRRHILILCRREPGKWHLVRYRSGQPYLRRQQL